MNDLSAGMNMGKMRLNGNQKRPGQKICRTFGFNLIIFEQETAIRFYFSCNPTLFPSQSINTAK
jgi:hypothetical protein